MGARPRPRASVSCVGSLGTWTRGAAGESFLLLSLVGATLVEMGDAALAAELLTERVVRAARAAAERGGRRHVERRAPLELGHRHLEGVGELARGLEALLAGLGERTERDLAKDAGMVRSGLALRGSGTGSLSCMRSVRVAVSPVNGTLPVSSSNSTMPTEYRSARPSSVSPRPCSGLMYSGVPHTRPGRVSAPRPAEGAGVVLEDLREAEVDDLHEVGARAQGLEHDVVGLEVAVDDAEGVRLLERGERLPQHVGDAPQGQRPLVVRDAPQVAAAQVLHDDVRLPLLGAAEVEDGDGVRVAQAACGARLVEEARRGQLVVGQVRVNDLDRDRPPERDLLGAVHAPHAADADHVRDAVAARQRASQERIVALLVVLQGSAARKAEAMRLPARSRAARAQQHR